MADNIDQSFSWVGLLFYVSVVILLIVAVLSFLAYHSVTHGARIRELILIWIVAVGGSIVGSLIAGILVFYLYGLDNPNDAFAAQFSAAMGILLGIPIGVVVGGLAGTILAALLVYLNAWRPTLIASVGALVVGALVSGVALVPIGYFFWAVAHI